MLHHVQRRRSHHHYYHHHFFKSTTTKVLIIISLINFVNSRNIRFDNFTTENVNLTIKSIDDYYYDSSSSTYENNYNDKFYEDGEIISGSTNHKTYAHQDYSGSEIMFNMPIAAAVLASVIFLICCYCCLRCVVEYDGVMRTNSYGKNKKRVTAA